MNIRRLAIRLLCLFAFIGLLESQEPRAAITEKHLLYVAVPGIRNYVEHGGIGILVFDIDNGYKFVKRIPTWDVKSGEMPENIKGIAASARTGKLYVSTTARLGCFDLITEKKVWRKLTMAAVTGWLYRPTVRLSMCLHSRGRIGMWLTP